METGNLGWIFLVLALVYAIQIFLSGRQIQRFYKRIKVLRKDGLPSIGMGGGKWRGRTYAVLVADAQKRITNAEAMTGWTTFASLKPFPQFVGYNAAELLEEDFEFGDINKKTKEAFIQAAEAYFKPDPKTGRIPGEEQPPQVAPAGAAIPDDEKLEMTESTDTAVEPGSATVEKSKKTMYHNRRRKPGQ